VSELGLEEVRAETRLHESEENLANTRC